MLLKYLLVLFVAFSLGMSSPAILAKSHGKLSAGHERQTQEKHKHKPDEKHQKKRHKRNSNKQSDKHRSHRLRRAEQPHLKRKHKKHDCDHKNCITPHAPKAVVPAPLPHRGGISINVSTPPQVDIPAVPKLNASTPAVPALPKATVATPAKPAAVIIDKTAKDAKPKADEIKQ